MPLALLMWAKKMVRYQWGAWGGKCPGSSCTLGEHRVNRMKVIAKQRAGEKGCKKWFLSRRKRNSGHKLRETTTAFCNA